MTRRRRREEVDVGIQVGWTGREGEKGGAAEK